MNAPIKSQQLGFSYALLIGSLLPFVSVNFPLGSGELSFLKLFDISKFVFFSFFITFFSITIKVFFKSVDFILILLFLCLTNFIALFISIGLNRDVGFIDLIKFPLTCFFLLLLPILLIKVFFFYLKSKEEVTYSCLVIYLSNFIVLSVCLLQINSMFNLNKTIASFYNNQLFYFFEGRWGGWSNFISLNSNNPDFYVSSVISQPIVMVLKRLSGTFQEPSSLAIYISLAMLPFFFSMLEKRSLSVFFKFSYLPFVFSPLILLLSFSSSGYFIFIIDFILFLFAIVFSKSYMKIFLVFVIVFSLIPFLLPLIIDYWFLIEKLYSLADNSSSTRYGSIFASFFLFLDNPLGVGYAQHTSLLSSYLPSWGYTDENLGEKITLHSFLLRLFLDFGVFSFFIFLLFLNLVLNSIKNTIPKFNKSVLKYYSINLLVLSISDLPFDEIWFLYLFVFFVCFMPTFKKDIVD